MSQGGIRTMYWTSLRKRGGRIAGSAEDELSRRGDATRQHTGRLADGSYIPFGTG